MFFARVGIAFGITFSGRLTLDRHGAKDPS